MPGCVCLAVWWMCVMNVSYSVWVWMSKSRLENADVCAFLRPQSHHLKISSIGGIMDVEPIRYLSKAWPFNLVPSTCVCVCALTKCRLWVGFSIWRREKNKNQKMAEIRKWTGIWFNKKDPTLQRDRSGLSLWPCLCFAVDNTTTSRNRYVRTHCIPL